MYIYRNIYICIYKKPNVSQSDLVLLLCSSSPWSVKTMKWKKYVLLFGVKECMASPESFPFTDKHAAASVNKIHGGKKKEWDTFDSHKGFFPLNKQRSNKICAREVPRSLKQRSINLEQILFLLQRYYFNFYAWMTTENAGGGGGKLYICTKTEIQPVVCLSFIPCMQNMRYLSRNCHLACHLTLWPPWKKKNPVLFQNEKAIFLGFIIFRNSQPFFFFF